MWTAGIGRVGDLVGPAVARSTVADLGRGLYDVTIRVRYFPQIRISNDH